MVRASPSVVLPGLEPTTMVIGLAGKFWAVAMTENVSPADAAAAMAMEMIETRLLCFMCRPPMMLLMR
jgi:hypothetical protein